MGKLGSLTASQVLTAAELNAGVAAGTAYSPGYVNITLGNATVISKYGMVGRLYVVRVQFTLGSTSVIGTGPTVSMPFNFADAAVQSWTCDLVDISAGKHYDGRALYNSASTVLLNAVDTAGATAFPTSVTSAVPFTWATGDWFSFEVVYEGVS